MNQNGDSNHCINILSTVIIIARKIKASPWCFCGVARNINFGWQAKLILLPTSNCFLTTGSVCPYITNQITWIVNEWQSVYYSFSCVTSLLPFRQSCYISHFRLVWTKWITVSSWSVTLVLDQVGYWFTTVHSIHSLGPTGQSTLWSSWMISAVFMPRWAEPRGIR